MAIGAPFRSWVFTAGHKARRERRRVTRPWARSPRQGLTPAGRPQHGLTPRARDLGSDHPSRQPRPECAHALVSALGSARTRFKRYLAWEGVVDVTHGRGPSCPARPETKSSAEAARLSLRAAEQRRLGQKRSRSTERLLRDRWSNWDDYRTPERRRAFVVSGGLDDPPRDRSPGGRFVVTAQHVGIEIHVPRPRKGPELGIDTDGFERRLVVADGSKDSPDREQPREIDLMHGAITKRQPKPTPGERFHVRDRCPGTCHGSGGIGSGTSGTCTSVQLRSSSS